MPGFKLPPPPWRVSQSFGGGEVLMADERMPCQIIDDLAAARAKLSDAQVLAELAAVPPLADEADPCWEDDGYWHWVVYPYLALWNVAAERQLRAAVPLILG